MKTWEPTDEQLLCRDLQHSWKPESAYSVGSGFVRTLRCVRCGSVKEQSLNREGYITRTTMKYPDGYLRPEGRMTKGDRAELRVRNLNVW